MDGQQYLNRISGANGPARAKVGKRNIFSSKYFIIGAIGLGALILIMIVGAILGGGKGDEKTLGFKLYLHLDNTNQLIQEYQPALKSSDLRSSSAALNSILSDTNSSLNDYLVQKYSFKPKNIDKKVQEEATLARDDLSNELFEAKINGILDRIYAHKMAYEIASILTEEATMAKNTKNETLIQIINKSTESLNNIYDKFNDFSEAK